MGKKKNFTKYRYWRTAEITLAALCFVYLKLCVVRFCCRRADKPTIEFLRILFCKKGYQLEFTLNKLSGTSRSCIGLSPFSLKNS